ncbi:Putative amidase signature (AS) superfamily [Septoria linicola]|uniref:Amidase signature (AS) superfamily n=1 Tax=Septoria linicola TaxID=215465 RepID=A0A9Q9B3S7_9PEZI|nr:Putative amidase signature (AS) superfamily [Septoria linicola]
MASVRRKFEPTLERSKHARSSVLRRLCQTGAHAIPQLCQGLSAKLARILGREYPARWLVGLTFGSADQSEYTVVKVDAYHGINSYLAQLEDTSINTIEHVFEYNLSNAGSEGGKRGIHPAFPPGQDGLEQIIASKGEENEIYHAALAYVQRKCRAEGIDGALKMADGKGEYDALLFCDVKGVAQQIAAQAGYPIVTIPIGVDDHGIPLSLSLQHTAWKEPELIQWASAIEDALKSVDILRPLPTYRNASAKNIPVL